MANYTKVFDETKSLFYEVLDGTSIPQWVEFQLIANNDLKELYRVNKLSDLYEFMTDGKNIVVCINEEIFDGLQLDMKKKILEELLGGIVVDEKDKIKIEAFDFTTHSGFLAKYGADEVIKLKESVKSLFDVKREKEEQEKAEAKAAKKKK